MSARRRQNTFTTRAEAEASHVEQRCKFPLHEITSSAMNLPFADPTERGPFQIGRMYGETNFGMVDIDWQWRTVELAIRRLDGQPARKQTIGLVQPKAN